MGSEFQPWAKMLAIIYQPNDVQEQTSCQDYYRKRRLCDSAGDVNRQFPGKPIRRARDRPDPRKNQRQNARNEYRGGNGHTAQKRCGLAMQAVPSRLVDKTQRQGEFPHQYRPDKRQDKGKPHGSGCGKFYHLVCPFLPNFARSESRTFVRKSS